jgi:hypothetical protein
MNKRVIYVLSLVFSTLSSLSMAGELRLGNDLVESNVLILGVQEQRKILLDGIKTAAAASLNGGKNNCRVASQCKVISLGICGDDKVLYSTFRSKGLDKAISTMQSVDVDLYKLTTPVLPGCPFRLPPLPQCKQSKFLGWHCAFPDAITVK